MTVFYCFVVIICIKRWSLLEKPMGVRTRLSLKCSAWKGFKKFASKKILGPKNILCQKIIFKKNLVPKNFGLKKSFV